MESIGKRMKKLRLQREISIEDMARSVGCAPSTFRDWENGRAIQGEPYLKIATTLEVSLKELLTGEHSSAKKALLELTDIRNSLLKLEHELLSLD